MIRWKRGIGPELGNNVRGCTTVCHCSYVLGDTGQSGTGRGDITIERQGASQIGETSSVHMLPVTPTIRCATIAISNLSGGDREGYRVVLLITLSQLTVCGVSDL